MRRVAFSVLAGVLATFLLSLGAFSWGSDTVIHHGWIRAFDIDSSEDGVMYAVLIAWGLPGDPEPGTWPNEDLVSFYAYRSEDHGHTWEIVKEFFVFGDVKHDLSTLQLVVGKDGRGDLLHIFFVNRDLGIMNLWNLSVPSMETTAYQFGPVPSAGIQRFDVARSYFSFPEEYVIAAAVLTRDDRIHVWCSPDQGATWQEAYSDSTTSVDWDYAGVVDLAWVPPLSFVLTYAGDMPAQYSDEDFVDRITYPEAEFLGHTLYWAEGFGWAGPGGWSGPWLVMDQTPEGILIPGDAFAYHIGGAFSTWRHRNLFLIFERHSIFKPSIPSYLYDFYYSWYLERPDAPEDWTPEVRLALEVDMALWYDFHCMDILSPRGQSGRYVYILQSWGGFMQLLRADSEAIEGFPTSVIAFGMNDEESYYEADYRWLRLAPKLVFSSYNPPDDCVGVAYSKEAVWASWSDAGSNLYYDGSCHGIFTAPFPISADTAAPIVFDAVATATCEPNYSHEIQVSWSFQACATPCHVIVEITSADVVLAVTESGEVEGSATLHVSLASGGSVSVTVTVKNATGMWSSSQGLTLDPC